MSYPTDLLPYGEVFAELDLVVRQLDDGSLTVTEDDSLPDAERVHVSSTEQGLKGTLVVMPASSSNRLLEELERLSNENQSDFVLRDGSIYCEITIPWDGVAGEFSEDQLRSFYRTVADEAKQNMDGLGKAASGKGGGGEEAVAVPPSFLAGAGQRDGGGPTQRFGKVGDVPGRAELTAREHSDFRTRGRFAGTPGGGGGGGGGGSTAMVAGAVGLMVVLAGVAFFIRTKQGAEEVAANEAKPNKLQKTAAKTDQKTGGFVPSTDGGMPTLDSGGRTRPKVDRTPVPRRTEVPDDVRSLVKLAGSSDGKDREVAVKNLLRKYTGRSSPPKGTRLSLLKALNKRIPREMGLLLKKNFRAHPLGTEEALDALEFANTLLRRQLIIQLGQPNDSRDEVDLIVEILSEQKDTSDLLIEKALIQLGRPKKGAALRLIKKFGVEWVGLGEGKEILGKLPFGELKPLVKHSDAKIRLLGCNVLSGADDKLEAAKLAESLLNDKDSRVKRRAIETLGNLRQGRSVRYIAWAMTKEKDARTLELMRNAISRLPYKESTRQLRRYLKKRKSRYRHAAVLGLRAIAKPIAIPPLVDAVKDKSRKVRYAALQALQALWRGKETKTIVRSKGILEFRRIALDRSDPQMRRIAQDLCVKIDGRVPR